MKNVAHFGFKSSKMEGFFAFLWCATHLYALENHQQIQAQFFRSSIVSISNAIIFSEVSLGKYAFYFSTPNKLSNKQYKKLSFFVIIFIIFQLSHDDINQSKARVSNTSINLSSIILRCRLQIIIFCREGIYIQSGKIIHGPIFWAHGQKWCAVFFLRTNDIQLLSKQQQQYVIYLVVFSKIFGTLSVLINFKIPMLFDMIFWGAATEYNQCAVQSCCCQKTLKLLSAVLRTESLLNHF